MNLAKNWSASLTPAGNTVGKRNSSTRTKRILGDCRFAASGRAAWPRPASVPAETAAVDLIRSLRFMWPSLTVDGRLLTGTGVVGRIATLGRGSIYLNQLRHSNIRSADTGVTPSIPENAPYFVNSSLQRHTCYF